MHKQIDNLISLAFQAESERSQYEGDPGPPYEPKFTEYLIERLPTWITKSGTTKQDGVRTRKLGARRPMAKPKHL